MQSCNIKKTRLIAIRFRFRVYVTDIINDNDVSIYFCDFGDVTIVSRSSLQPLKSDFMKLPYQAVKAKLIGKKEYSCSFSSFESLLHMNFNNDLFFIIIIRNRADEC